jgi:2'-5' RNA ligase
MLAGANVEVRLFIALTLPAEVLKALAEVQRHFAAADQGRAIRWTPIDHTHLTLKFLGEASAAQVDEIAAALRAATADSQVGPFTLRMAGVGAFPDTRRPRVIWAGLEGDTTALHALQEAVERTISPLGFPTEPRPFSPHLTIGRARREADASALLAIGAKVAAYKGGSGATWAVKTCALMRSDLRPSGVVYSMVMQAALGPRDP